MVANMQQKSKQFITRIYYTCVTTFYLHQVGYVFVVVCLFVSNFAQKKLPNGFAWNSQGRLAMGRRTND